MNCIRCGRETESDRIFCPDCLTEMEKHPVDPHTPVLLPKRGQEDTKRSVKRRAVSAEEQLKILKKRYHAVLLAMLVGWLLVLLMVKPALTHLMEDHFAPGQNYSTIITPSDDDAEDDDVT